MNVRFDFSGRAAVITGGAQGIGAAIARGFLDAGAHVAVWDYSEEALERLSSELGSAAGSRLELRKVDVSDEASCAAAAAALPFRPQILVNNAGITRDKSIGKLTLPDFEAVIRTNLTGAFVVTKSLLDRFDADSKCKRIINMASVVALYGNFGQANYAAAKAGLVGMTRTLARELGRKGFTVNAVAPGFIRTRMVEAMPAEVLDGMAAKVPVGRLGMPNDIAAACLYLASDEAAYINGAVLSVDGGIIP